MQYDITIEEFKNIDDKIGDNIVLDDSVEYSRDYPFIYLEGKLYIADSNIIHADLLDKICNKELADELYDMRVGNKDKSEAHVSFGHIINNVGIIDPITNYNVSINKVTKALLEYGVDKVYVSTDDFSMELKRIARW